MTPQNYIHQVLIEENPYTLCINMRDRYITYEEAAFHIYTDLIHHKEEKTTKEIVVGWLEIEFGSENIDEKSVTRCISRISMFEGDFK